MSTQRSGSVFKMADSFFKKLLWWSWDWIKEYLVLLIIRGYYNDWYMNDYLIFFQQKKVVIIRVRYITCTKV